MNEDPLFCVSVSGVGDVIPVHSMSEAVKIAAYMNAEYLEAHQVMTAEGKKHIPYCFAAPELWPHSPEDHANWLAELKERAKGQSLPYWMCA